MDKVIDFKEITISDRKFIIKKFDARTGSYMLFKVVGLLAPAFKSISPEMFKKVKGPKDLAGINFTDMLGDLMNLKEEDFRYIQDKCLGVCSEALPAGNVSVLDKNGNFSVIGLETDTMTVLSLTTHALIFNLSSFFGAGLWGSLGEALNTSRHNART